MVRQGRKPQSALDGPPIPWELAYLLEWFGDLERMRNVSEAGLMAIGWREIEAWARLTDRKLLPYEVDALAMLDYAARFPGEPDGR